jgi:formate hydrogenlyase subunit 6/NADH:ubiquinone oxidoreductase subunit I
MQDVYERLRERLDQMATGFPKTEDRVEIRLLKRLFTEEEADCFLQLGFRMETAEKVSERLKMDPVATAVRLDQMVRKGLLFRNEKDGVPRYAPVPYVVGIFEFQLNRVDPEMARDMESYYQSGLGKTFQAFSTPVMRTIPINRSLVVKWPVAPYEDALEIINRQDTVAIAPCICRKMAGLIDKGCGKSLEACFMFGSHAEYYVQNNMGRYISKGEAAEIVRRNETEGLVMQPFNAKNAGGMCSCCGDCCGMLRSLKMQPVPAAAVQSNYFAQVDEALCIGCETCIDRCQMEAIRMEDEKAGVDLDRCIGCGLCVTTCPTEAMQLVKKPEDRLYEPPESGAETYMRIARERAGKAAATGK